MKTLVVCLLDRSGSMLNIREDTIGSFNCFLTEQKNLDPEECNLTLILFDDEYDLIYNQVPVDKVPLLTRSTFVPRGSTSLMDAWYQGITTTEHTIQEMSVNERPNKVLFVVLTDGLENTSVHTNKQTLLSTVSRKKAEGWEFIFLGANQDAVMTGIEYGIGQGKAMTFSGNGGVQHTMGAVSRIVSATRTHGITPDFDDEERSKSLIIPGRLFSKQDKDKLH